MRPRATSIGIVGAVLLTLTGCTFTAAQTVQEPYDPSDGFGASLGDIAIRNALLITDDGSRANLLISLVNEGNENVQLTVSWEGESGQVDRNVYLSPGAARTYAGESNRIILSGIDAAPGATFPLYFQYGDAEGLAIDVPVLNGALPEYGDLLP